jgi:hypothetical protein
VINILLNQENGRYKNDLSLKIWMESKFKQ